MLPPHRAVTGPRAPRRPDSLHSPQNPRRVARRTPLPRAGRARWGTRRHFWVGCRSPHLRARRTQASLRRALGVKRCRKRPARPPAGRRRSGQNQARRRPTKCNWRDPPPPSATAARLASDVASSNHTRTHAHTPPLPAHRLGSAVGGVPAQCARLAPHRAGAVVVRAPLRALAEGHPPHRGRAWARRPRRGARGCSPRSTCQVRAFGLLPVVSGKAGVLALAGARTHARTRGVSHGWHRVVWGRRRAHQPSIVPGERFSRRDAPCAAARELPGGRPDAPALVANLVANLRVSSTP